MKLFLLNNTKFGYKNNSKDWFDISIQFFEDIFIPFIQKNSKPDDIVIFTGNIFNSSELISINILLKIKELFDKINSICELKFISDEPILNIFNFTIIDKKELSINNKLFVAGTNDNSELNNIIHLGAPYQFENTDQIKGFYVVDSISSNYKFIENKLSPRFKTIIINNIDEIDNLNEDFINKNNVNVIINRTLVDDKKIKLDVLLSKYNFKNITYINEKSDTFEINNNSLDIEELIKDNIKENSVLLNEFESIMKIYKEKYI